MYIIPDEILYPETLFELGDQLGLSPKFGSAQA